MKADAIKSIREQLIAGNITISQVHNNLIEQQLPEEEINNILNQLPRINNNHQEQNQMQLAYQAALEHADNNNMESVTTTTSKDYDSSILENSVIFKAMQLARSYLKAKDAALKAKGAYQREAVQHAIETRNTFMSFVPFIPTTFNIEDVVNEYSGLGREWTATGKMVKQFADANGIDQQLAADLVTRQMTVAQDYAQATRGLKFGRYCSWLADTMKEAADLEGNVELLEDVVLQAYNRAAQWNQPADGMLIREFASSMGISENLPTWAEVLQKNMPSKEAALEARKRISNRASAAAAQEAEEEAELTKQYGSF